MHRTFIFGWRPILFPRKHCLTVCMVQTSFWMFLSKSCCRLESVQVKMLHSLAFTIIKSLYSTFEKDYGNLVMNSALSARIIHEIAKNYVETDEELVEGIDIMKLQDEGLLFLTSRWNCRKKRIQVYLQEP